MMNRKAEIIQVQAGAGSGKTYKLSHRYIEILTALLKTAETDQNGKNSSCNMDADGGNGPGSVLAITFTNKAAAEMKERILYFLKRIAFRDNPEDLADFAVDEKESASLLTTILRDFSDFQVKTIDSFMNNILKAFAVDAGLFPDFRLEFDADDVFALVIETMFDTRPDLLPVLKEMLTALLRLDDSETGFDPRRLTAKLLFKLKKIESRIDCSKLSQVPPFDGKPVLKALKEQAIELIDEMAALGKGIFNGRSFAPERNRSKIDRYGEFPPWMTDLKPLSELKNKKATVPNIDKLQEKLDDFRLRYRDYMISKAVEAFRAPVQVFGEYTRLEKQLFKELNQFEISKMAPVIHNLLQKSGAPIAFCRLGEQYSHYLIDEFQDTSRSQWDAMSPLVANSLSKGGSLFFVGDTKQAIYGWRGGDYKLFNDVPQQPEIRLPVAGNFSTESLDTNYRSGKRIVAFNNSLFAENSIKALASTLNLPDLIKIYEGVEQKTGKDAPEGRVTVRLFQETDKDTRSENIRKWSREIISDTVRRFGPGAVLILARSREKVRTIAGWLVDLTIPFVTEDSLKLFGNLTVKSLLALLSSMVLPSPDSYLFGLLETGFFGKLSAAEATSLLQKHGSKANREIPAHRFLKENAPDFYRKWLAPLGEIRTEHSGYELASHLVRFLKLEQVPERSLIDRFLEEVLILEENGVTDTVDIVNQLYEKIDETSLSMPETKDVVRVMTIHKAKGLESPVVILPFLDWKLANSQNIIIGESEPDSGKYLRINKTIANLDPELGKIYEDAQSREMVESINLLYVALTRAGQELYIGIPPVTQTTMKSTVSGAFQQMMKESGFAFNESDEFSIGTVGESGQWDEQKESSPPPPPLRAASGLLPYGDTWDEPFEFEARLRGTLLHKAMSFIHHIEENQWINLDAIAKEALERGAAALGVDMAASRNRSDISALSRILTSLKPWFSPSLPAWNEKEFVGEKGEMIRVDRLVKNDSRFILIDYKTGQPTPRHHHQIHRYLKILQPLGKSISGVLAYFDTGEVENVRP